jgi:DNA polymerase V
MTTLDKLNQRYGRGTVKVSTQGAHTGWQMRQERKSPNYTTNWDTLPLA